MENSCAQCGSTVPTMLACKACGETQYCGEACQTNHWEAHKKTCLPDMAMWQDLLKKELKMLRELPPSAQQKLSSRIPFPFYFFLHSGEIALVLARIKPCSVVRACSWIELGPTFYENVLQPCVVHKNTRRGSWPMALRTHCCPTRQPRTPAVVRTLERVPYSTTNEVPK